MDVRKGAVPDEIDDDLEDDDPETIDDRPARRPRREPSLEGFSIAARVSNAQAAQNVTDLQRELTLIQQQAFITQQAHGLGLGGAKDHAFILAAGAPPLADDAPGSAAVRLGGEVERQTPLESWLSILFGPPGD